MTEGDFVWEEPPGYNRTRPVSWKDTLAPLRENPGRWARIETKPSPRTAASTAANLRRNIRLPDGEWEFASRTLEDGRGAVYARYLGDHEEAR